MNVLRIDDPNTYTPNQIIHVKFMGKYTKEGIFDSSSQLLEVSDLFPINKVRLIYNGVILNKNLSFSYYGMQDNSVIYVINDFPLTPTEIKSKHKMEESKHIRELHKYFLQKKNENEQLYSFNSKRSEIDRLKDLLFSKHEVATRRYKRFAKYFVNKIQISDEENSPLETIIPDKSDAPSTEILPFPNFE